jgi:chromosomal replication initiation ATPase DnaA
LSREVFTTWLLGVTLVAADETTFTMGVRHAYARDWLETRLKPTIQQALSGAVGHSVEVAFVLHPTRDHA